MMRCRFIEAMRRAPSAHLRFRFLCIQSSRESSESDSESPQNSESLFRRIEKLRTGEAVGSAFRTWMGDGFPIHRGHVFHAINRLRKLNMNKRPLEVMEWVIRERPYRPRELDYSYLVEFTIKLHGIEHGEKLFPRIPTEFQNELLYNNLVIAMLDKGVIKLSLEYMKKMRELAYPISHLVFNRLIILHSSPSRKKLIPKLVVVVVEEVGGGCCGGGVVVVVVEGVIGRENLHWVKLWEIVEEEEEVEDSHELRRL
ncbi:hypothetical protein S83_060518 [Arachis hypogaea]|uniref:Pentatricopeptide repeat-containing protein n=1 Tax=Arachis hypogaea TaxID=3818 RepID=A0A445CA62_ARAHY|nr:hypothetical protein Ahy_A07g033804 [Arachis hypogaea]